jgi:cobaltochelatase CobN
VTEEFFLGRVDEAIRDVASLDESSEDNYVRKHVLESGDGPRIFASKPGTYGNGVKLAVYASAWKEEKDLSDVFIYWNGYAYGKGVFGEVSHERLVSQLKSVEMTFNKTATDEYDLFGCCCYFGTHGGLTIAAREVSAYYGDTRDRVVVRCLADEVRYFFEEKNPWAMEEIGRRLLEANQRGLWDADPEVMEGLKAAYLEMEGWIEERLGETGGDFQGGAVDAFTSGDVEAWRKKMSKVLEM